jgi:hypothetical protein
MGPDYHSSPRRNLEPVPILLTILYLAEDWIQTTPVVQIVRGSLRGTPVFPPVPLAPNLATQRADMKKLLERVRISIALKMQT